MKFTAKVEVMDRALIVKTPYPLDLFDGEYEVTIREVGKSRSLDQNAKLWALVSEISMAQYGTLAEKENVYIQLLQMAGARYETLLINNKAIEDEALEQLGLKYYKIIEKGTTSSVVIAFYGSSTFNTKEMNQLIETTLNYASEIGIPVDEEYWKGILNG